MMNHSDDLAVIRTESLTRRYGRTVALDAVDVTVLRGSVFGLVGVNGAGKTTLIKHVLGLLAAESGRIEVFGSDPIRDPVGVLSRIGYLSEENDLPGWMRISELMKYTRAFYPNWDDDYATELQSAFDLNPTSTVGRLSKGQKARVGLLLALAHRPELLVFDEPSSGLDPIVRRDILQAIIQTIAEEGRTIVFSSHLLNEVERVADQIAFIDHGRIVYCGSMDEIKSVHRMVTVRLACDSTEPPTLDGALSWNGGGREWTAVCRISREKLECAVASAHGEIMDDRTPTLDDIFAAEIGRRSSTVSGVQ